MLNAVGEGKKKFSGSFERRAPSVTSKNLSFQEESSQERRSRGAPKRASERWCEGGHPFESGAVQIQSHGLQMIMFQGRLPFPLSDFHSQIFISKGRLFVVV